MKLYLRLCVATVSTILLSGGSCSAGKETFSADAPPVAAAPADPAPAAPAPEASSSSTASDASTPPDPAASSTPGPASSPVPVTFTSFSAIRPNQTVVADMVGKSAQVSAQQQGADWSFSSFFTDSLDFNNVGAQLTYDASGALSGVRVEATPVHTLDFQRSRGDSVSCTGGGSCRGSNASQDLVLVDPTVAGWNYQTFGIWGAESLATSGRIGAVSIGASTPGDAIPTTGSATFTGLAIGIYSDASGVMSATRATLAAGVNFGTRSIGFNTSNTVIGRNGTSTAMPGLNLSGTLTYGPSNPISGAVQTQNGALTGSVDGRFYGPNATEIGGVYSLSGSGMSRMLGGFGGRR